MKKKLLSILLVFCMILGMMPAAFAEDDTASGSAAKIGDKEYETLAAAIDAANDGDTITLLTDVTEDITIPAGKALSLDLSGKVLTIPSDCGLDVLGKLTVADTDSNNSGKITSSHTPVCIEGSQASFTLASGTVESTADYGIYAKDGAAAIINGGLVTSVYSPLSGNNTTGDMNFEVHGGTLTAQNGPAIYMPGQVNLTITDGILNGGISLRMGQVNISGGTINSIKTGIDSPSEYYNYSGNAWLPDALYILGGTYTSDNATYGNSLNLNITGGTFNCLNDQGSAIGIYDLGKVAQESKITISGNAVLKTNSATREAYQVLSLADIGVTDASYGANSGKVNTSITGGCFSSDPSAYAAEDYEAVKGEDGLYTVSPKAAVAKIGDTEYTSLAKAIDAAQDGDTITLLTDVESPKFQISKTLTIDLDGHAVTGPSNNFWLVVKGGNVTLTGNGTFTGYAAASVVGNTTAGGEAISSTLTVESGSFSGTELGILYEGNGAKVVVNDGTISGGDNAAIMGNGTKTASIDRGNTTLIVNGGTITGNTVSSGWRNCAIYLPQWGNAEINGGTITGTTGAGIVLRGGNLTVTGGTISGKGTGGDDCKMGDANPTYCGGLEIGYSCNYPGGIGKIVLSGGTFTSETSDAVKVIGTAADSKIEITKSSTISITGGSYSSDPGAYVAEDYKAVKGDDGLYTIAAKDYVAKIGTTSYESLAEAIAAAKDGDTVTLLADTTEDISISGTKNLTLDLGGKTLTNTGKGKATLFVGGGASVSVKNGSIVGGASYYNIQCGTEKDPTGSLELTDVTATAGNTGSSMIDNWGTLTIQSGTYTGGLNTVKSEPNSTLTINGGNFSTDVYSSAGYTGVILNYGHATLNDGTFASTGTGKYGYTAAVIASPDNKENPTTTTVINGGTYTVANTKSTFSVRTIGSTSSILEIRAGSFNPKPYSYSIAPGYGVAPKTSTDPYYTIAPAKKVTVEAAENGKISGAPSYVVPGNQVSLSISPATGYTLDTITVKKTDGTEVTVTGNSKTQKFTMPDDDVTISLTFKKADYAITLKQGVGGTISTEKPTANYNDKVTLTVTPDPGYKLNKLTVSPTSVKIAEDYTFTMPSRAVTITASFTAIDYTVSTADTENGTIAADLTTATVGTTVPVTVTPAEGYALDTLYYTAEGSDEQHAIEAVDGAYSFTMPAANATVHATFKAIDYTVTAAKAENGTVTVDPETATIGSTVAVKAAPAEGYELDTLYYTAEGSDEQHAIEAKDGAYTFTMPAANVTVTAAFKAIDYTVTAAEAKDGSIAVDPETATIGTAVAVKVTPDEGYELKALYYTTEGSDEQHAIEAADGAYTFTMPAANVTVHAIFKAISKPGENVTVKVEEAPADTKVSDTIDTETKDKLEAVADNTAVTGVADAADQNKILAEAKVDPTEIKDAEVDISIYAEVEATEADLTKGTLTFAVSPKADVTVNGTVAKAGIDVTNDMLDGSAITVKLPIPEGFTVEEVIHTAADGTKEYYRQNSTTHPLTIEGTGKDQVAVLKVTHFSTFTINAKAHTHTWDKGTVIKQPTDKEPGEMLYTCTDCKETKTEKIPVVAVKSLTVDPEKVTLTKGDSKTLTVATDPKDATGTPVWTSSKESIVTVDETGKVTAVGTGKAIITVTLGDQSAQCEITVVCGTETCQYYTDVPADMWCHAAVDYVTENGIMQGYGNKIFNPNKDLTRAQLAKLLYNLENPTEKADTDVTFSDVAEGDWCYDAVMWAASAGVVKGYTDGTFRPNTPVNRQEMVTMIYRYAQYKDLDTTHDADGWTAFEDSASIGNFAKDAVAWAAENGVVNGYTNGTFKPRGTATRGHVAQVMMKFAVAYELK